MPEHGTINCFYVMGCRCEMCAAAYARHFAETHGRIFHDPLFLSLRNHIAAQEKKREQARVEHQARIKDSLERLGIRA